MKGHLPRRLKRELGAESEVGGRRCREVDLEHARSRRAHLRYVAEVRPRHNLVCDLGVISDLLGVDLVD